MSVLIRKHYAISVNAVHWNNPEKTVLQVGTDRRPAFKTSGHEKAAVDEEYRNRKIAKRVS